MGIYDCTNPWSICPAPSFTMNEASVSSTDQGGGKRRLIFRVTTDSKAVGGGPAALPSSPYVPSNPQHVGYRTTRKEESCLVPLMHGHDSTKPVARPGRFYGTGM